MSMTVGIDISKDWLEVGRFPEAAGRRGETRFANDARGHAALIAWLARLEEPARIVFEATGAYHRGLALERAGRPFCKVNPRRARRFAQAAGRLAKTDRLDAAMLARMGHVLELDPDEPRGDKQSDLSDLSSARATVLKDLAALAARRRVACHDLVLRQLDRRHAALKADLDELDAALAALIAADEALRARAAILVSIPGLGDVSAAAILAGMPELGGLGNRQAAALAGVAPSPLSLGPMALQWRPRSSGQWRGRAFIGGGRAAPRRALYMPALVASRCNPDLSRVYERLLAAGKPKKLALVAVMRKLVVLANALLRDGRKWTPRAA